MQSPKMIPDLITINAAVERSGWSAGYLRSLTRCGKLDSDRGTGRVLVDSDCLAVLLRARAARRKRPKLRLVIDNTRN